MRKHRDYDEYSQGIPKNKPVEAGLTSGGRNPLYVTQADISASPNSTTIPRPISDRWAYTFTQEQDEKHYIVDSLIKAILTVILGANFTEEDIEEIDWEEITASEIDTSTFGIISSIIVNSYARRWSLL